MKFITLTQRNGERVSFNISKIFFVAEERKKNGISSFLQTDDGTNYYLLESFDEIMSLLPNESIPFEFGKI